MQNERLKEILRPLASAVTPPKATRAQRLVLEGFRNDGSIEPGMIAGALPLQRLDWFVDSDAPTGEQPARYFIPELARVTRIALVSAGSVESTFVANVLINGSSHASGSIRAGRDRAGGVFSLDLPGGSVVSIQTTTSIPQGVTVSVFYRPVEE